MTEAKKVERRPCAARPHGTVVPCCRGGGERSARWRRVHFRAAASALLLLASSLVRAATWTAPNGVAFDYEEVEDAEYGVGAEITCCRLPDDGLSGDLEIPPRLGGLPVLSIGDSSFDPESSDERWEEFAGTVTIPWGVRRIGDWAFSHCRGLTSVTIPSSVKAIGDGAFLGCLRLASVTIPSSVEAIGDGAFWGCLRLTSVTIPAGVTEIGIGALSCGSGLRSIAVAPGNPNYRSVNGLLLSRDGRTLIYGVNGRVTIPFGVVRIECGAFAGCRGLTSVSIPESVTTIGGWDDDESYGEEDYAWHGAFSGCSGLTSVTIPSGVTQIGDGAFSGCSGLTSVTIPAGVTEIGEGAFSGCSGLTSVTIPASVTQIGYGAFSGCSGLTSVTIPASVTQIGYGVFSGCSGLTSVAIPASVMEIRGGAFSGCSGLTSVTIPSGVTQIWDGAFSDCSGLTSVTIPSGVTRIRRDAFSGCSGLMSVTIPSGVTQIDHGAFSGCSGLMSVTIPSGVTQIDYGAFSGCSGLQSFTVAVDNPNYMSANGLLLSKDWRTLVCGVNGRVVIPYGVRCISSDAFSGCSGLTSVAIPSSVTQIWGDTFSGCGGLQSITVASDNPEYTSVNGLLLSKDGRTLVRGVNGRVTIPAGVTRIVYGAFSGCGGLTSVTIPDGVTRIEDRTFSGCGGLVSVTIPASVTNVADWAFSGCGRLQSFAVAPDNPKYKSVDGLLLSKDGRTLVRGVNGRVTIPYGVTEIGGGTFSGCGGLTSVTIPASVTNVAAWAFDDCGRLQSFAVAPDHPKYKSVDGLLLSKDGRTLVCGVNGRVTIPDGVTRIGDCAFSGCSGLTSVTIPSSVTEIGGGAFSGCSGLTSVAIPPGVVYIGADAFCGCTGLRSVSIPTGAYVAPGESDALDVRDGVFDGCDERLRIEWTSGLEASYGPFAPGEPVSLDLPGLVGYAAKGLPAGLKFDARTGRVTGAATKGGESVTAAFTKRGAETVFVRFVVGPFPVLAVECDSEMGQAAGAGAYAAGKKITLKATARKGHVFAGWYADADFETPLAAGADWRTPSLPYVTGTEDMVVYARFVPSYWDDEPEIYVDDGAWDRWIEISEGRHDYALCWEEGLAEVGVSVDSYSLPTVRAAGLPAGLKFDAKAMKITGRPTKPGVYTVTFTVSNAAVRNAATTLVIVVPDCTSDRIWIGGGALDAGSGAYTGFTAGVALDGAAPVLGAEAGYALKVSDLPPGVRYDAASGRIVGAPAKPGFYTVTVTGTRRGAPTETATFTLRVEAMPAAVAGTFTGNVTAYDEGWGEDAPVGSFTFTATAAGRLTAKVSTARGAASFAASSWTRAERHYGDPCCGLIGRGDVTNVTFVAEMADAKGRTLTVAVDADRRTVNAVDGVRVSRASSRYVDGGAAFGVDAVRNAFARKWHFAVVDDWHGDEYESWELSGVETAEEADVTVTLRDGTATVAGRLGGVKVSGRAVVRVEAGEWEGDGLLHVRLAALVSVGGRMRPMSIELDADRGRVRLLPADFGYSDDARD